MADKYIWDEAKAIEPVHWMEDHCRHYIGEKKKGELLRLEPFQVDIVTQTFGWRRAEDPRLLKHSVLYVEIPRGNAKSTLATAMALYIAFGAGIPSSKVFVFAGSQGSSIRGLI